MVTLTPLQQSDREKFIKDNQEAFNYGALEEFGMRDNHFEEDEQFPDGMFRFEKRMD
ncbi:hypothetical protein [Pseudobutyrivibrio sp. ACV-2]|uniref:hypothetical protein n=1 Tax=Pseudobutyrivibrio sp. ACV-2 TaxID=1520801 RepID=UPI001FA6DC1F|nr:hypothetical protein [Pseudobutyrivibrio sp. ACV-2]